MLSDSIFPLCYMPAEDIDESNKSAATKCPPTLIGSAFCIGQDASLSYFLTAGHNFTKPESDYLEGKSRLFIGARLVPTAPPWSVNYLPVVYKGNFGSPSHISYDEGDLVIIHCPNDALSRVVPIRLSPTAAKKGDEIEHVGVLDVNAYFATGTTHSTYGKIDGLSHFLNRKTMNSGASYITTSTIPHGLSGGCCLKDGHAIGVNVNGFTVGRAAAESVLQMTKHHQAHLFFPAGYNRSAPWMYAPFVIDREAEPQFTSLNGASLQLLVEDVAQINGDPAPTWTDEVLHRLSKGLWIRDFGLEGDEKEQFLNCLLSSLLGFYISTGIKIPLSITPISSVYP